MADEQSQANGTVQDPESGLGTQDTDSNNLLINGGADSNNIAQNNQLPQVEDIGPVHDDSNDLSEDDKFVFSRQAYRALLRDRARLEALKNQLKNEATAPNVQSTNVKDLVNNNLNMTNDNAHTTSIAQPNTVQPLPQSNIDTSVRPRTYASVVKTPCQNNDQTKPAPGQPTVTQTKRPGFTNNKFNKFRNFTGTRPSNLHNFQWSNKKPTPEFHLNTLNKKLSTLNFNELNKIKSLLNKKIQYKQFQFSYAKNPLTVFTANKLRKLIYQRITKSHAIAEKEAQNNLGFNQIQYYTVEGILFRLSRLPHTLRDKVITEYEKESVINYVCKETNCYHCANGSIERIYIETLIAEFGPKYHSFANKNKRLNNQLCKLDQLPSKEDKQVTPHTDSMSNRLTQVQKVMTSKSTQTTTINNKTVSIQTDLTTQLSNSTQTRRVSLVSQEVQTMTPDNVTLDETNKLTQNTSTEDLNSASRNNTPSLGESNNSSTEQIKNDINIQMSSRDESNDTDTQSSYDDLNYSSSAGNDAEIKAETSDANPTLTPNMSNHDNSTPPNRNPDSKLTAHEETSSTKVFKSKKQRRRERKEIANANNNDEKTCNLHIEQKYMDYLKRAIKRPDLSENIDLVRCHAEAVLDNPQNIEFLDIAFLRERISFLYYARSVMKRDGSLSEKSKTNAELRIAYVMKLEKYMATNKPIKHAEITDLLYQHRLENNPSDPDVSKDQVVGNLRLEKTYFKYIKKAAVESILKDNVKLADCYKQAYEVYQSLILFSPENENYFASVCLVGSYDIASFATHCLSDNGKLSKKTKEIREIRMRYYMMVEGRVRKKKPINIYEMEELYKQYVHEPLSAYK